VRRTSIVWTKAESRCVSEFGDEQTHSSIARNGSYGALNGPNADGVALGPRKWPLL
jgi:hypothetical protein